jgi:L-ribulose-5-phosphate 4-epimerase
VIIEKIEDLKSSVSDCPGILLNRHGPFVWGANIEEAFRNAKLLEYIAELALKTNSLCKELIPLSSTLHAKHFTRKHGNEAYYGQ